MNEISAIRPLSDEQAASLVSVATMRELQESILEIPLSRRDRETRRRAGGRSRAARVGVDRGRPVGIAAVGALAVAVVVVVALATSGGRIGSLHIGAQPAQALSITRHDGEITVIVRNPLASPATFRRELTDHHLHIRLQLIEGSPSIVGTVEYISDNPQHGTVQVIQARGRCRISATRDDCPVGVRVAAGYSGSVSPGFSLPPRPEPRTRHPGQSPPRARRCVGFTTSG